MGYKLSQAAKQDLQRIYSYCLEVFGEEQADKYFFGFFDAFENIARHPKQYQSVDNLRPGYRRCIYGSDAIYFRMNGTEAEIMAILGSQDLDLWGLV